MWEIPLAIVTRAIYDAIQKTCGWTKDKIFTWNGTIEDLNEHGIYEDDIWRNPIEINGTFSEFIPFVNFAELLPNINRKNIPPSIGTCRLGDSVVSGKYVGALYLPDEHSGINTPAVPLFYDNKILLSRSIMTGDQVKLKCRILELEDTWRRIFSPKKTFEFECKDGTIKPYGLEVLEVKSQKSSLINREFEVDFWAIFDFPQYNEFTDFLGKLGQRKQIFNCMMDSLVYKGDVSRAYRINKEGVYEELFRRKKDGIYEKRDDSITDIVQNFYLLNRKTGTFMTYNKIDVGELPNFNKNDWVKASEFVKLHLIDYPFYFFENSTDGSPPIMAKYDEVLSKFIQSKILSKTDIEFLGGKIKINSQIKHLKDLKAYFQSDQVRPFVPQKLKVKDFVSRQDYVGKYKL